MGSANGMRAEGLRLFFMPLNSPALLSRNLTRREGENMSRESILHSMGSGEAYSELLGGHYANEEEREALKYLSGMSDEQIDRARAAEADRAARMTRKG
jgi:hypothetical protein